MGWYTLLGSSRKDIIEDQTCEVRANNNYVTRALRHCCRGNVLWVLRETTTPSGATRWIDCIIMSRDNRTGDWSYKPVDESMGPNYYTCPLAYLDAATTPQNGYARRWREAVRETHAEKKVIRKAQKSRRQLTMGV